MLFKGLLCAFWVVFICSGVIVSAQETNNSPPARSVVKAPSSISEKLFLIDCTNSTQRIDLRRWAETVAAGVARAVGLGLPCGKSMLVRISVNNEDAVSSGRVVAEESGDCGIPVRHLKIYNYEKIRRSEADEALCRLLLDCYVASAQPKMVETADAVSTATQTGMNPAPKWFYLGMSRYIYQNLRARDIDVALGIWKKGRLKPFPELLTSEEVEKDYPYGAAYGVMIAWIVSSTDRREIFGRMFGHLASGGTLSPGWFAKNIPKCNSAADVDEKWENWIIHQWRVVYRPGTATVLQVEQLKEHLALKQSDAGMPLSSDIDRRIGFRDLIGMKFGEWLPAVLRSKIMALKVLAIGKGKDFGDVVDAYCRFLDAVVAGKKKEYLRELLEKADKAFELLEIKVAGAGEGEGRMI